MDESKKQCLVITAYKSVDMLRCLLKAVHEKFLCYVHVDQGKWKKFEPLKEEFEDVIFLHDYSVKWGGAEHLEAILKMLDMATKKGFSYVHIISGEDYPTVSVETIIDRFNNDDKIYCDYSFVSSKKHCAYRRYSVYWPYVKFSMNYKNQWVRYLNLTCVAIQMAIPWKRRNHIGEFEKIYCGFIWGTYPQYAVEYVLNYLKHNHDFWNDLTTCKIPEEFCFQTILLNSKYNDKIVNSNLRYWNFDGGDNSGPVYLKENDLNTAKFREALFCRKVDYSSNVRKILEAEQSCPHEE